jgi:phosphodiesterase/alkaline phosphatase D-like protein
VSHSLGFSDETQRTFAKGRALLHYGIMYYGTDAKNLSQVAKSPNRRNPSHPDMIFRVRIAGLNPQTTYYYTVESTGATGVNDGVSSPIKTFKTK